MAPVSRSVEGWKFVRGFLQHVLPRGFRKVRHYGWMASNSKTTLDLARWLALLHLGWIWWLASGVAPQPKRHTSQLRCKDCGGSLHVIMIINAQGRVLIKRPLPDHAQAFQGSG